MSRVLLALWVALFAVQTCEVVAAIAPDGCVEQSSAPDDRCPESCARCVCCARVPAFIPQGPADEPGEPISRAVVQSPLEPVTTPSPRAVFHVPKPL